MLNKNLLNNMIHKHAIEFSSRRRALRELCKCPGNHVLEQDGTYYLQVSNHLPLNVGRSEIRCTLLGRVLPEWMPVITLKSLGIRKLQILHFFLQGTIVYLDLDNYWKTRGFTSKQKALSSMLELFFFCIF